MSDKKKRKKTDLRLRVELTGVLGDREVDQKAKLTFNPKKMGKGALEGMRKLLQQAQELVEEQVAKIEAEEAEENAEAEEGEPAGDAETINVFVTEPVEVEEDSAPEAEE